MTIIKQVSASLFAMSLVACQQADTGPEQATAHTVIHNGTVLTMNADQHVINDGVVILEGRDIVGVGTAELANQYPGAHLIDAQQGIIMPGMINLHNHLSMVAFRGLAESGIEDINDRLFNYFFPLEAELLDRELIYVSARHAAIEMIMGGVTTTTDMYYHEDEVAKAVKEVGLRGILGETVIGFPVVDATEPFGGLEYAEKFIQDWLDDPLITPAVAPHAPYTLPPEQLQAAKALGDKYNVPVLIHMAEFDNEEEQTAARYPDTTQERSSVEYLDSIGFLGPNVLAAHTIFVSESDIELLKKHNVGISHNPKANTKDMSGLSPAWDMYTKGLNIGLGTDGPMSSNQLDILNVMPYAARIARIAHRDIGKFNPADIVHMATLGGARALHMEDTIGSLEVGKRGDVIILETGSPNMQPNYNPYATIVFSAYPANVSHTIVDGQLLYANGTINTVDIATHERAWKKVKEKVQRFAKTFEQQVN